MPRNYKISWKGSRKSRRFGVTFEPVTLAKKIKEKCTVCGGDVEEVPMMRGTCYGCYQKIVAGRSLQNK